MNNQYNAVSIKKRITSIFNNRGLKPYKILPQLGLSKNTLDGANVSMPKADTLAIIADYLETTTDYLLGRSDNPNMGVTVRDNTQNNVNGNNSIQISAASEAENEINFILSQLSPRERTELMIMIYRFADEHKK